MRYPLITSPRILLSRAIEEFLITPYSRDRARSLMSRSKIAGDKAMIELANGVIPLAVKEEGKRYSRWSQGIYASYPFQD